VAHGVDRRQGLAAVGGKRDGNLTLVIVAMVKAHGHCQIPRFHLAELVGPVLEALRRHLNRAVWALIGADLEDCLFVLRHRIARVNQYRLCERYEKSRSVKVLRLISLWRTVLYCGVLL